MTYHGEIENEVFILLECFHLISIDIKHEIDKIIRFLCKGIFISKNKLSEFGAIK